MKIRNRRLLLILTFVAIVFCSIGINLTFVKSNPLLNVDASELQTVSLRVVGGRSNETITISEEYWTDLLANLSSSKVVENPHKWSAFAVLNFLFQDGREITVVVNETGSEIGCFEVDGKIFTGGSEQLLKQMIEDSKDCKR